MEGNEYIRLFFPPVVLNLAFMPDVVKSEFIQFCETKYKCVTSGFTFI